jgi:hypothetical protein
LLRAGLLLDLLDLEARVRLHREYVAGEIQRGALGVVAAGEALATDRGDLPVACAVAPAELAGRLDLEAPARRIRGSGAGARRLRCVCHLCSLRSSFAGRRPRHVLHGSKDAAAPPSSLVKPES